MEKDRLQVSKHKSYIFILYLQVKKKEKKMSTNLVCDFCLCFQYLLSEAISLQIVTIVALAISLACLFVAFIAFCCLRNINSNLIGIHTNLIFSILAVQLLFVVGINRTEPVVSVQLADMFKS